MEQEGTIMENALIFASEKEVQFGKLLKFIMAYPQGWRCAAW